MAITTTWSEANLRALRQLYPDTPNEIIARALRRSTRAIGQRARKLGLRKSSDYMASAASGRLQPNNVPHNKGQAFNPGGRSAETRFKPGSKPRTTLPIGSLRITKDGHLQRKATEASGSDSKRWRAVAELVWIEANGPLPDKHIVVFKPGQSTNQLKAITLEKVECISRAENIRRNCWQTKHPELNSVSQLKGAITRQVNRIKRQTRNPQQEATA